MKKTKVLILGHTGMLGHMVLKYLSTKEDLDICIIDGRWPNSDFKNKLIQFDGNFIINCIGAIHQRTNKFEINWELPEFLDKNVKSFVIHPGTDCEMDNDDYGVSKKRAKDFIVENSNRTKSLKTSIIGPEVKTNASLMNWLLSQPDNSKVFGYTNHFWNGNTTLTWSKYCYKLIKNWDMYNKETVISSECISKYEILILIAEIFNKKIIIEKKEVSLINKCLDSQIKTPHIKEQLIELKKFID